LLQAKVFKERLGTKEVADRVENLYFSYLFVLRAVMKIGPKLKTIDYQTGMHDEDAKTSSLITQLVSNMRFQLQTPRTANYKRLGKLSIKRPD
jgi:ERO1-like protein alpha